MRTISFPLADGHVEALESLTGGCDTTADDMAAGCVELVLQARAGEPAALNALVDTLPIAGNVDTMVRILATMPVEVLEAAAAGQRDTMKRIADDTKH